MSEHYEEMEPWRDATKEEKDEWARSLDHLLNESQCCNCTHWRIRVDTVQAQRVKERGHGDETMFTDYAAKGRCVRFPPHPRYNVPVTEYHDECGEFSEGRDWAISLLLIDETKE